jgi:hypothetical protein
MCPERVDIYLLGPTYSDNGQRAKKFCHNNTGPLSQTFRPTKDYGLQLMRKREFAKCVEYYIEHK